MKIELTQQEAIDLSKQRLNEFMPQPVENVTIINPPPAIKPYIELMPLIRVARDNSNDKISRIKLVRALANDKGIEVGLADAKAFVEVWT